MGAAKVLKGKRLDKEIERIYYLHGFGVQVDIMDIPRIFADCRRVYESGGDLDLAVREAIAKYRKN